MQCKGALQFDCVLFSPHLQIKSFGVLLRQMEGLHAASENPLNCVLKLATAVKMRIFIMESEHGLESLRRASNKFHGLRS